MKLFKSINIGAISAAVAILVIGLIQNHLPSSQGTLLLLASLGATSTIIFYLWSTPVARPWNVFFGHLIGGVIGVVCQKLIYSFDPLTSMVLAIFLTLQLMGLTKSTHPPAGAVALIATSGDPFIQKMGWALVPSALFGAGIIYFVGWLSFEKFKFNSKFY